VQEVYRRTSSNRNTGCWWCGLICNTMSLWRRCVKTCYRWPSERKRFAACKLGRSSTKCGNFSVTQLQTWNLGACIELHELSTPQLSRASIFGNFEPYHRGFESRQSLLAPSRSQQYRHPLHLIKQDPRSNSKQAPGEASTIIG